MTAPPPDPTGQVFHLEHLPPSPPPPDPTVSELALLAGRSHDQIRHRVIVGELDLVPTPDGWRVGGPSAVRLLATLRAERDARRADVADEVA